MKKCPSLCTPVSTGNKRKTENRYGPGDRKTLLPGQFVLCSGKLRFQETEGFFGYENVFIPKKRPNERSNPGQKVELGQTLLQKREDSCIVDLVKIAKKNEKIQEVFGI